MGKKRGMFWRGQAGHLDRGGWQADRQAGSMQMNIALCALLPATLSPLCRQGEHLTEKKKNLSLSRATWLSISVCH